MKEKIIKNKKQLRQAHVLRNYNEKVINRKAAAEALSLSERQITRLAKEIRKEGESALISQKYRPKTRPCNDAREASRNIKNMSN